MISFDKTTETIKKTTVKGRSKNVGSTNGKWRGDSVSYRALHSWVMRQRGEPTVCEKCGNKPKKRIRRQVQWANISKKYLRDLNDWIALCITCHRQFDSNKLEL